MPFTYGTVVLACVLVFRRWRELPGWVVFALSTFASDLLMMGLAIAQITVLGLAGVPAYCDGLAAQSEFFFSSCGAAWCAWCAHVLTFVHKEAEIALSHANRQTAVFMTDSYQSNIGSLCHLPRGVYGLCVAAV